MDKNITLRHRIDWAHKSIERLERSLEMPPQEDLVKFHKREAWLLLRRSWEIYWAVRRMKVKK